MSKSNRSRGSEFLNDLITVDFEKIDIYTGVRIATLIAPLLVIGLITRHESSLVILGAGYILAIDEGLFFISYFRVFSKGFMTLKFAGIVFVIAIVTQGATLTLTGQASLLVFIGGLWAIFAGVIFPARRTLKPKTTNQSVQQQNHQQPQAKSIQQDRFKLFTSNLSIHSQYFQFALALAITSAVGLLIAQWLKLQEPDWVLISIVVILMPAYNEIFLTFRKVVHRIVGTLIGAIIAIVIIGSIDNQWLLTLLVLLFTVVYVSVVKTRNYAFQVIFMTVMILLLVDIPNPNTDSMASFARFQNIIIGSLLSLLVAFIIWIVPKIKSNPASGSIRR